MRENCSGFSGRRRYACFHLVDLRNINNMNEAFERQFCSGCLGPQITTKIGFTDKTCSSNTLISSIATYLQCKLLISIILVQNKTEQKISFLLGSIHFLTGGGGGGGGGTGGIWVGQPILTCFKGVGLFIVLV
jgi:hypothetical protein